MLDPEFLSILACPACKTGVVDRERWLICQACGRRFPVREGIPVMLLEEAMPAESSPSDSEADP